MRKTQGVKRLGSGKYLVTVVRTHPTDRRPDGRPLKVKRKRIVDGGRQEAEQAHQALAEALEVEIGIRSAPTRLTLAEFAKQWLVPRSMRLAFSTIAKYRNDLDKHILPALGHRLLDELKPSDIRAMLARDDGADNSRKNRLALLRAMAKDAMADGLIDRDFCLRVSVKVAPVYSDEEPNMLTPEQLGALLDHFDESWLDALYVLAFTGMRWCEVAGLKWDDLDLDQGVVRIRRANVKGRIGPPKTRRSRRTLGLIPEVVARLRARRKRMLAEGHPGLFRGWVFPREDGEHYAGYPLRDAIENACKAAGIAIRFTTHGLRRTYNDLARRHVDAMVLRAVVGHTTEEMSEHYSRIDIGEKRAASAAVANIVRPRSKSIQDITEAARNGSGPEVTRKVTPDALTTGVKNAKN